MYWFEISFGRRRMKDDQNLNFEKRLAGFFGQNAHINTQK